ncbi:Uncharacterized protein PKNOH_S06436600 [Plasmodium knowlesi]|uniref:Uncharacterized protein n=1 Tax=Plasmodium knowlesi TaxID=5850 RepID=A0A1Y3DRL8_PLAKN|nr:Uncharacterized protein PKNOH_S06436600 [Plasmodium knowlesi]
MFRPNNGAGGNTNFPGPRLAGLPPIPPPTPPIRLIHLLKIKIYNKGYDQFRKLYDSPMNTDGRMTNNGWYSYGNTYGSPHLNSPKMISGNDFRGNGKENSQHGINRTKKKGPVLYGLLDEEQGHSIRIKSGELYKGIKPFRNQPNARMDREYDDDEFTDDESELELEDDYYDGDYDFFDYGNGDYDLDISNIPNGKMSWQEKYFKKQDVNENGRTNEQSELKELMKNEMKTKILNELINQFNSKQMDTTTQQGKENAQVALNLQILQAILKDEITTQTEANTNFINREAPKSLSQLNLELTDAENKYTEKKKEQEQKVTQMEKIEEEINQIKKQIENVKHKRNIYVDPNEEYRQLLFLYPQNKMLQEQEKTGLLMELEKKYKVKEEEKENLLKNMQEMKKELQCASNEVQVLRARIKVKERREKYNKKVNQPSSQLPWVVAEEQVKSQAKSQAQAKAKVEAYVPNTPDMPNLPQLSSTPSLKSLSTHLKGAVLPSWVEDLPEPVKMGILSDLQQKLEMMEPKIHTEADQIEQQVNCVY